jgi:hypothetical protein
VVPAACIFFCRRAMGAASARHSPCPLLERGQVHQQTSDARIAPRESEPMSATPTRYEHPNMSTPQVLHEASAPASSSRGPPSSSSCAVRRQLNLSGCFRRKHRPLQPMVGTTGATVSNKINHLCPLTGHSGALIANGYFQRRAHYPGIGLGCQRRRKLQRLQSR